MRQYLETARCNEIHYQTPEVVFYFVQGVTEPLANLLRKNGITVKVRDAVCDARALTVRLRSGFDCGSRRTSGEALADPR